MADFAHSIPRRTPSSSKITNVNALPEKNVYEDVFGGGSKFAIPSFSSVEDYSEVFSSYSSSRGCSIPFLDLPVVDDELDVFSSELDYSEIFSGLDSVDYAVSYDELFLESKAAGGESSEEEEVWTPAESGSPSEESSDDPVCSESNQALSNVESDFSYDNVNQFKVSYHMSNQMSKEDGISGTTHIAQLNAVPAYTFVVDENLPVQTATCDNLPLEKSNDHSQNADITDWPMDGEHYQGAEPPQSASGNDQKPADITDWQIDGEHYRGTEPPQSACGNDQKPADITDWQIDGEHYRGTEPPQSACGNDQKPQKNLDMNGSCNKKKPFLTVTEISLRTQPSEVPPPARPPPKFIIKQGVAPSRKFSANYAHHGAPSVSSPPIFDVEVDASSSAAASAAAMKEAMEQAEARLKTAKELMERKKDGLQHRKKMGMKEDSKGNETRGGGIAHDPARVKEEVFHAKLERKDSNSKEFNKEEKQKGMEVAQVAHELEVKPRLFNISKEPVDHKQSKERKLIPEPQWEEVTGEWKAEEQFFELVKKDTGGTTMVFPQHKKSEQNFPPTARVYEQGQCGKKGENMVFVQQDRSDEKLQADKGVSEVKEDTNRLKASQEAREKAEHDNTVKAAPKIRRREEHEKKLKETHEQEKKEACEQEKYEKKLKQAHDQEDHENKLRESLARLENENKRKETLQREEREQKQREIYQREENEKKQKETCEREDNERRQKEALENERRMNEKKEKEAREREENERKQKEARAKEDDERRINEKKQEEAREREENERRQKEAHEKEQNQRIINEKKQEEAREREENERRQKEAHEKEENQRIINEKKQEAARKREENERRQKEAHEKEENEKKINELKQKAAREREENERREKEAREKAENEKRLKDFHEMQINERKLKLDAKESERRLKEVHEGEEDQRRQKEESEREENEKRLKESCEREENERKLKQVAEEIEKKLKEPCEEVTKNILQKVTHEGVETEEKQRELEEQHESEMSPEESSKLGKSNKKLNEESNLEEIKKRHDEALKREENDQHELSQDFHLSSEEDKKPRAEIVIEEITECEKNLKAGNTHVQDETENSRASGGGCEQEEINKKLKMARESCGNVEREKVMNTAQNPLENSGNVKNFEEEEKSCQKDEYERSRSGPMSQSFSRHEDYKDNQIAAEKVNLDHSDRKSGNVEDVVRQENDEKCTKEETVVSNCQDRKKNIKASQRVGQHIEDEMKVQVAQTINEEKITKPKVVDELKTNQERKETYLNGNFARDGSGKEGRTGKEKEQERERLRKLEEDRQREREKDRMAVERVTREARERAYTEARERAERVAVERATAEARQRAMVEARERLEKACAEAREKSLAEKAYAEARLRAERAAVERATAEARERAVEKAMAERAAMEARERVERSFSEKFSATSRDGGLRHTASFSDLRDSQFQSSGSFSSSQRYPNSSHQGAFTTEKTQGTEGDSAQRCKAKLERHQRTVERAAKALAEKNLRDHLAQREQAERNRLAESLDADVKRWCSGKEGNLRALLSTLQYILGSDSGWQPVPLTEVITAAAAKKAYRKATLCVHPDKLQQRGASIQQKYICEKVFDLLKDAWNKFNSEER